MSNPKEDIPLVTITVCVRNGEQWIDGCLSSLVAQDWGNTEIIAVDDGSIDNSREKLLAWDDPEGIHNKHPIKVLTQSAKGLSAGRSLAVKNSSGQWIAITDIDVRPEPSWISELMKVRTPFNENETVVAITGRTVFESGTTVVSKLRASEIAEKYRSRSRTTSLANGPCSIFERQSLLDIGEFDEDWYHAEDMEVSLLLINSGGTIVYTPDAVVNHVAEENLTVFLRKRKRDARAHVRIVRHHPKRDRTIGFDFIGSAWWVLTLLPVVLLAAIGICLNIDIYHFQSEPFDLSSSIQLFSIICLLPALMHLLYFPQTVIGSLLDVRKPFWSFKLVTILFLWSCSLWLGLAQGYTDAIFGRRGH